MKFIQDLVTAHMSLYDFEIKLEFRFLAWLGEVRDATLKPDGGTSSLKSRQGLGIRG